ncbi:MAG: hypothetical protein JNM78_03980 [Cyclobacteriaceae bacterium]|nr:hypothetical protein [Cyclobacteriaceae bacterium]
MSQSRQLAAIMFTDIVGYTALMGSDNKKALAILQKNRELQKPIIKEFNGRWIKELGDGAMASFNTAADAVYAAIKIQEACSLSDEFKLKIGIHLGDVLFENDDVFGDGVNIASRIESLAIAGAVLMSKAIRDQVKNNTDFQLESLGHFDFKNVSEPMEVFALANSGFAVPKREEMQGKLKFPQKKSVALKWIIAVAVIVVASFSIWFFKGQRETSGETRDQSIAVLAFVDMSQTKDQEYFSDGLSENVIDLLAKVPGLKVIGRTSSFSFKGRNEDLRVIGEKLGAANILEGSVQKDGNKLRITAQLIRSADGFHLWSDKFDRELKDVFSIQDEISLAILEAIKVELIGEDKEVLLKNYTDNVEAYQLFLKGRYHYNKYSPDDFSKAIAYYRAAIDIDSSYAIAYAELAICYGDLAYFNWAPMEQSLYQARTAAEKAIQLDDNIAESHIVTGRIKMWNDYDFKGALQELEKGLSINPNSVEGLRQLGVYHMVMENYPKANQYLQQAERLDPFSLLNIFYLTGYHQWDGDSAKQIEYANRLLEMAPNFFAGHFVIGAVQFFGLHQYEKGIVNLELAAKMNGDLQMFSYLGTAYGLKGEEIKAREILDKMNNLLVGQNQGNAFFGYVFASIGEWEQAYQFFDKAVESHEGEMLYIKRKFQVYYPAMKNDPRTKALLKKIELPN